MRSRLKMGVLVAAGLCVVCGLGFYGLERARNGSPVSGASRLVSAVEGLSKLVQDQRQFASLNHVGIHFYAIVQDQFGEPVTQATIKCSVTHSTGFSQGQRYFTATSDARGYFEIHPGKEASFSAVPEKSGYELASSNCGGDASYLYGTNRFVPDKNKPVVIKMWKLQGAEPLIRITRHLTLPASPQAWRIDLLSGNIVESGGDIKLSLERPVGELSFQRPLNWSIHVEAVDGGLFIPEVEVFRYSFQAPDQGYQDKITVTTPTEGNPWQSRASLSLFVMSRRGLVHAKGGLGVSINKTDSDPIYLDYSFLSNAQGSRNWEQNKELITER